MRKAINENRTVQLVLVAVLFLAGGLLLMKSKGGGGDSAAAEAPVAAAPTTTTPPSTAAPTTTAPATDPAAAALTGTAAPAAPTGAVAAVPTNLIPGPGLPKSFLDAYRDGEAIALLIRRAGGRDDALVRDSVELLNGLPDVAVFVTKARHIARYAWLTQGVNVTELPALVILRPKHLSGGKATASVSYGFRKANSVLQAAKDALYRGPTDRPYHP
jgi:hypothetical protein